MCFLNISKAFVSTALIPFSSKVRSIGLLKHIWVLRLDWLAVFSCVSAVGTGFDTHMLGAA